MKIRMIPENKIYAGTPMEIVNKLAADAIFLKVKSVEDYMLTVRRRLPSMSIEGTTQEEQCESFIRELVARGMAKVVLQEEDLDQYQLRLVRRVLRLSQEKFARKLGVSFASVNRWEKGRHAPHSGSLIGNLRRVARGHVAR